MISARSLRALFVLLLVSGAVPAHAQGGLFGREVKPDLFKPDADLSKLSERTALQDVAGQVQEVTAKAVAELERLERGIGTEIKTIEQADAIAEKEIAAFAEIAQKLSPTSIFVGHLTKLEREALEDAAKYEKHELVELRAKAPQFKEKADTWASIRNQTMELGRLASAKAEEARKRKPIYEAEIKLRAHDKAAALAKEFLRTAAKAIRESPVLPTVQGTKQ